MQVGRTLCQGLQWLWELCPCNVRTNIKPPQQLQLQVKFIEVLYGSFQSEGSNEQFGKKFCFLDIKLGDQWEYQLANAIHGSTFILWKKTNADCRENLFHSSCTDLKRWKSIDVVIWTVFCVGGLLKHTSFLAQSCRATVTCHWVEITHDSWSTTSESKVKWCTYSGDTWDMSSMCRYLLSSAPRI